MLSHRLMLYKHQFTKYIRQNKSIIGLITFIFLLLFLFNQFSSFNGQNELISTVNLINCNKNITNDYQLTPINDGANGKGAFINGLDLCELDFSNINKLNSLFQRIKSDVYQYEFVIFKNQCINNQYKIPPDIFTIIASQFGIISQYGSSHKANPVNTNITVLSNNIKKGKTTTGSKGWHIDGTSKYKPDAICFQHIISVPNKGYGGTQIISSELLLKLLKDKKPELYNNLNTLYMIGKRHYLHPVISKHPITNNPYLVLHTHYIQLFIKIMDETIEINDELKGKFVDNKFLEKYRNDKRLKFYSKQETHELLEIVDNFIENECRNNGLIYLTEYEKGDLLIRDNLALLHKSHPSAQMNEKEVGLRIMWRITLEGKYVPSK